MTPTEENESWISSVPPSATPAAPVADVGAGRAVAVGAVDVEDVDRVVDVAVGGVGERRHVAHPSATPARRRLASKASRSVGRLGGVAGRSPAGRGRCRRAGRWPRPRRRRRRPTASTIVERPRKLPISTIRPPAGQRAAAAYRRPALVVGHPAVDAGGQRQHRRQHRSTRRSSAGTPPGRTRPPTPRPSSLQHPVAGEDLLRRGAPALLEDERVAQQRRQHRHDRQLVERPVRAGQISWSRTPTGSS